MKTSSKAIVLLVCLTAILMTVVFANAGWSPPLKQVPYCFKILNTTEYPDYTFVLCSALAERHLLMTNSWGYNLYEAGGPCRAINSTDDCFTKSYRFNHEIVYAFKNSDILEQGWHVYTNETLKLDSNKDYVCANKTKILFSILKDAYIPLVNISEPIVKLTDFYQIVSLEENTFEIQKNKTIREYTDERLNETTYYNETVVGSENKTTAGCFNASDNVTINYLNQTLNQTIEAHTDTSNNPTTNELNQTDTSDNPTTNELNQTLDEVFDETETNITKNLLCCIIPEILPQNSVMPFPPRILSLFRTPRTVD